MAGHRGTQPHDSIGDLADARLSPSEAHEAIRQRLTRVTDRWGLKPADAHRLAREMQSHTYAPGETIVPRGVRAGCLGLVIEGQVAVHVGQRGAARLVVVLLPGSTFGEMMLESGQPSHATLQALTQCQIRFLRRVQLQALSDERQAERQVATLWRTVRVSAVLLALLLVAVLLLSLQPSREALALVPMGLGQWCHERELDLCAFPAWRVAASLTPDDPNPHLAVGTYYFEQGDVAAAERSFEAAKALAPGSPEAYNNLGLIYARQGEHEQAIAAFQQALELEPGVAATEHNLGLSLQATGDYDAALMHYQTALALGEPQLSTLLNMAIAYYESDQFEEAEEAARAALRLDQNLAPAYTLLAAIALESRQPEQALPDLHHAIALDASYDQAHFYLGLAYKSLDQPVEAIAAFEEALVNADNEVTRVRIRRHLGELYEAQEQSRAH